VLPPTLPGYSPYCPYTSAPNPAGTWNAPDVTKGKRLVRASGTRGMRITFWALSDERPAVAKYLGHVLHQLGYRVTVRLTGVARWAAELSDSRLHGEAGLGGWIPDYLSPTAFFDILLTCDSFIAASDSNQNTAEFCDPRLDALVHRAQVAQQTNMSQAIRLWQSADRETVDHAPWVPLATEVGADVISTRTGNAQHNTQFGLLLDQLWVR